MNEPKKIQIALGETVTLRVSEALEGHKRADTIRELIEKEDCRFHFTGGAAVSDSDEGSEEEIRVIGSAVGRTLISFGPDLSKKDQGFRMRFADSTPDIPQLAWDVEVVAKKDAASTAAGAAAAASPLVSSSKFDGLLPMEEVQEGPSEKTPYGMDQNNKPVAPFPGMVPPDASTVARQSEDAQMKGQPTSDVLNSRIQKLEEELRVEREKREHAKKSLEKARGSFGTNVESQEDLDKSLRGGESMDGPETSPGAPPPSPVITDSTGIVDTRPDASSDLIGEGSEPRVLS